MEKYSNKIVDDDDDDAKKFVYIKNTQIYGQE